MMAPRVIGSLQELTELAARPGGADVAILLAGGAVRSSKHITYLPPSGRYRHTGRFEVLNEIDGTWQTLWPSQLWTRSHIGEALDKRALILG
jgi:hypothetical protein